MGATISHTFWTRLDPRVDRWAIALGGVCLAHCLATTIFFAAIASLGGVFANPLFHEVGLGLAILFGIVALGRGIVTHGYMAPSAVGGFGIGIMAGALSLPHGFGAETLWTLVGVGLLALGHDLNRRAAG